MPDSARKTDIQKQISMCSLYDWTTNQHVWIQEETVCYCKHDHWVDNLNLDPTGITGVVQQTSKQKI